MHGGEGNLSMKVCKDFEEDMENMPAPPDRFGPSMEAVTLFREPGRHVVYSQLRHDSRLVVARHVVHVRAHDIELSRGGEGLLNVVVVDADRRGLRTDPRAFGRLEYAALALSEGGTQPVTLQRLEGETLRFQLDLARHRSASLLHFHVSWHMGGNFRVEKVLPVSQERIASLASAAPSWEPPTKHEALDVLGPVANATAVPADPGEGQFKVGLEVNNGQVSFAGECTKLQTVLFRETPRTHLKVLVPNARGRVQGWIAAYQPSDPLSAFALPLFHEEAIGKSDRDVLCSSFEIQGTNVKPLEQQAVEAYGVFRKPGVWALDIHIAHGDVWRSVSVTHLVCSRQERYRWSDPCAWGVAPPEGGIVRIPPGSHAVLDVSPPQLDSLVIDGTLEIDPGAADLALAASRIVVGRGGKVRVGEEGQPYGGRLRINLTSSFPLEQVIDARLFDDRAWICQTCELSIWGERASSVVVSGAPGPISGGSLVVQESAVKETTAGRRRLHHINDMAYFSSLASRNHHWLGGAAGAAFSAMEGARVDIQGMHLQNMGKRGDVHGAALVLDGALRHAHQRSSARVRNVRITDSEAACVETYEWSQAAVLEGIQCLGATAAGFRFDSRTPPALVVRGNRAEGITNAGRGTAPAGAFHFSGPTEGVVFEENTAADVDGYGVVAERLEPGWTGNTAVNVKGEVLVGGGGGSQGGPQPARAGDGWGVAYLRESAVSEVFALEGPTDAIQYIVIDIPDRAGQVRLSTQTLTGKTMTLLNPFTGLPCAPTFRGCFYNRFRRDKRTYDFSHYSTTVGEWEHWDVPNFSGGRWAVGVGGANSTFKFKYTVDRCPAGSRGIWTGQNLAGSNHTCREVKEMVPDKTSLLLRADSRAGAYARFDVPAHTSSFWIKAKRKATSGDCLLRLGAHRGSMATFKGVDRAFFDMHRDAGNDELIRVQKPEATSTASVYSLPKVNPSQGTFFVAVAPTGDDVEVQVEVEIITASCSGNLLAYPYYLPPHHHDDFLAAYDSEPRKAPCIIDVPFIERSIVRRQGGFYKPELTKYTGRGVGEVSLYRFAVPRFCLGFELHLSLPRTQKYTKASMLLSSGNLPIHLDHEDYMMWEYDYMGRVDSPGSVSLVINRTEVWQRWGTWYVAIDWIDSDPEQDFNLTLRRYPTVCPGAPPCSRRGECVTEASGQGARCACREGWAGLDCSVPDVEGGALQEEIGQEGTGTRVEERTGARLPPKPPAVLGVTEGGNGPVPLGGPTRTEAPHIEVEAASAAVRTGGVSQAAWPFVATACLALGVLLSMHFGLVRRPRSAFAR